MSTLVGGVVSSSCTALFKQFSVPNTLPDSRLLTVVQSAESKHLSLRIAYFVAVSRHD